MSYFYIVIPPEDQDQSQDTSKAVTSPKELQAILKRNPHARFHAASTPEEAMRRALEKIQFVRDAESISAPKAERIQRRGRSSLSLVEGSLGAPATPSPKTADLLMMGKEILTKQNEKVLARIEENPRILCTESEYPTILQEGCKLNAMHLAAKSGNQEILQKILNLVSSVDFMRRIYPDLSEERLRACATHLCTCYLNTPDKMLQDTPLHFACKFNAVECVSLLLSHPFCDPTLKNYDQETPFEVIGQRDSPISDKATRIKNLFNERVIVPIWRNESIDGDPPVLGEIAFIPDLGQAIPPPLLQTIFPDFTLSLLKPCEPTLLPKTFSRNRLFVSHPPSWKIVAFAGPVNENSAKSFRQVMKRSRLFLTTQNRAFTPDSSLNTSCAELLDSPLASKDFQSSSPNRETTPPPGLPPSSQFILSPISSPQILSFCESPARNCSPLKTDMSTRVRDIEKGLERIAFEYAHEMKIPWSEYWNFLNTFCDLSTDEGLDLVENYLRSLEESHKNELLERSVQEKTLGKDSTLDEVINKMTNMRLSNSGLASPDGKSGFCKNPNCRMEARFCNCEDMVPTIPYNGEFDMMDSWRYGELTEFDRVPFSGISQQFLGIRKIDTSANTDSFDASDENRSLENEFNWPMPENIDIFKTAPSSPAHHDVFEDCDEGVPVYFNGTAPGKLDRQVFHVLKNFNENLDREKHLTTFQWLNAMRARGNALAPENARRLFSHDETPNCTPKRLRVDGPSFVSTPVRGKTIFEDSF